MSAVFFIKGNDLFQFKQIRWRFSDIDMINNQLLWKVIWNMHVRAMLECVIISIERYITVIHPTWAGASRVSAL